MRRFFHFTIFFVLLICCLGLTFQVPCNNFTYAITQEGVINFKYNEIIFSYSFTDCGFDYGNKWKYTPKEILKKVYSLGFNKEQALHYAFKNLETIIKNDIQNIEAKPIESKIDVTNGEAKITKEISGKKLNTEKLYLELFDNIYGNLGNEINIELPVEVLTPKTTYTENLSLTNIKSSFVSYITGSNQMGRINNIKQALSKFNGFKLDAGETVSFNNVIGETSKENGYELAKVIINGRFEDDYGGGVCQAATTLYNAALLAGLKIEEVRPHSLKVGYVKGSFDAMVAGKYSDLVIKNNFNSPVFFYTYATDYECGVKIFGVKNEFEIKARSEKTKILPHEEDTVQYKSDGYLDYFKDNELIETVKIRSDKYYKLKPIQNNENTIIS